MALEELHDRYHSGGRGTCTCRCAYCYEDEYCQATPSVTGGGAGKTLLLVGAIGTALRIGSEMTKKNKKTPFGDRFAKWAPDTHLTPKS